MVRCKMYNILLFITLRLPLKSERESKELAHVSGLKAERKVHARAALYIIYINFTILVITYFRLLRHWSYERALPRWNSKKSNNH
jgi:hypothetical protein